MKMFKNLSNSKKGYSLIVLIIAIIVILLLAIVSIVSLRSSREKTIATNFIYDLRAVEEAVKNFYTTKGTLPTATNKVIDVYELASGENIPELLDQLSNEDDEIYYDIDLSQLSGIALKDSSRRYFVNNGSQNVYVKVPLEYQKEGEKKPRRYFTLNSDLVNGKDLYTSVEEDIKIVGNPIHWASKADLRMILPKRSLQESDWNGWTFRFSIGPKTQEEMEGKNAKIIHYEYKPSYESGERVDTSNILEFDYGEMIALRTNGTYTFYIKEPDEAGATGKVTLKNVNVTMIDDIKPKYEFSDGGSRFLAVDNETGIREVRYKTLANYESNIATITSGEGVIDENIDARTPLDFFLLDGKGKEFIYDLKAEIDDYIEGKNNIKQEFDEAALNYERAIAIIDSSSDDDEGKARRKADENINYENIRADIQNELNDLNEKYAYLNGSGLDGDTSSSRLVICIIDNADNAIVVGETLDTKLSTRILAESYNISLDKLEE